MSSLVSPSLNYIQASYGSGGGNRGHSHTRVTSYGGGYGRGRGGGKFRQFSMSRLSQIWSHIQ